MTKNLKLSSGAFFELIINSEYDYSKRKSDEYETDVILKIDNFRILICSDYLNFIVSKMQQHLNILEELELLKEFELYKIGIAFNDYLFSIDNEKELNEDYLKENNDVWIGSKYLLFELPKKLATWLFALNGKYYLEITPLYEKHFIDSDESSYIDFVANFKTLEKIELTNDDVEGLKNLINSFL